MLVNISKAVYIDIVTQVNRFKRKRGDELRVDAMKLKLLSAENGMNVQELADVSGVAFATVCKARAGKEVSERTVVKLARALQVDAKELIEQ